MLYGKNVQCFQWLVFKQVFVGGGYPMNKPYKTCNIISHFLKLKLY